MNEQENRRDKGPAGGGGHTEGFFSSRSSALSNNFSNGASKDVRNKVQNFVSGRQFGGFSSSNPATFCSGSMMNEGRNKVENYSKGWRNFDGFPCQPTTAVVANGFNASTSSNDTVRNSNEQRKVFNETLNSNFSTNSSTSRSSMDDGFSTAMPTASYQNLRQKKKNKRFAGAKDFDGIPEHMLFKTIIPVSFDKHTQRNDEYEKEISDLVNRNEKKFPNVK